MKVDLTRVAKFASEQCPHVAFRPDSSGSFLIAYPLNGLRFTVLDNDGRFHTAPVNNAERVWIIRAVLDAIADQIEEAAANGERAA